jgi:hypothetical protein
MTTSSKHSRWATDAEIITDTYRGPDRRRQEDDEDTISKEIRFDEQGNSVLDVRTEVPRRREDDDTVDLIESLDADALGLELED